MENISNPMEKSLRSEKLLSRNRMMIILGAFLWAIYFIVQGQFLHDYLASFTYFQPIYISVLVIVVSISGAIVSILAGAISDHITLPFGKRKPFILVGGFVSASLLFALPFCKHIASIIFLNVIMSIFNTAAFVCNNSFIPDSSTYKNLGKHTSLVAIGSAFGTIAGYALMIIQSSVLVFFIAGGICVLGYLILGIVIREPSPLKTRGNWLDDLKVTLQLKTIQREHNFLYFLISHFFLHTGINIYLPFLVIFLTQDNHSHSSELIGLGLSMKNGEILIVFIIMTILSLVLSLPFGYLSDQFKTTKIMVFIRLSFAIGTALICLTPLIGKNNPLVIGILFIIPYSITNTGDTIFRGSLMYQLIPYEKRAQFLGWVNLAKICAQIPGVLIGGLLAQFLQRGYQYGFLTAGFLLFSSLPFLILIHSSSLKKNSYQKSSSANIG
ncbi:MAG: MFS transporter [Asgard group archaeon]|nr:MFS transporter [Asgard group archaeon]